MQVGDLGLLEVGHPGCAPPAYVPAPSPPLDPLPHLISDFLGKEAVKCGYHRSLNKKI